MFNWMNMLLPLGLLGMMTLADGDGGGGTGDEGDKGGDKGSGNENTVSKADHDKVVGDLTKTKEDLEDMRMEVLSPEYLEYLNAKNQGGDKGGGDKGGAPATDNTLSDDKIEKMTKKEILELAETRASAKYKVDIDKVRSDFSTDKSAQTKREVAAFGRAHEDFNTYRPIMYGLSIDPKNAGLTLTELYSMAKEHIKGIHSETTEAEKERQKKLVGEKPGGAQDTYERLSKLSPNEAAKEAFKETKDKLGIDSIPSA